MARSYANPSHHRSEDPPRRHPGAPGPAGRQVPRGPTATAPRARGWHPARLGRLLVLAESRTNRRGVERHGDTFSAVLPQRTVEARRWLRQPSGPLAALRFLSPMARGHGKQRCGGPSRVRVDRRLTGAHGSSTSRPDRARSAPKGSGAAGSLFAYHVVAPSDKEGAVASLRLAGDCVSRTPRAGRHGAVTRSG